MFLKSNPAVAVALTVEYVTKISCCAGVDRFTSISSNTFSSASATVIF